MKKILLIALCLSFAGLIGCSDDDSSTMNPYSFGINSLNTDELTDMGKIENYLASKGCIMEPQVISGKNDTETDEKARVLFNSSAAKISVAELDQLGLSSGTSFSYAVSRLENPTDPDSKTLVIASFSYPE